MSWHEVTPVCRRPGTVASGWHSGVSGAPRPPGQAPRLSRRAWRGGERAVPVCLRASGCGGHPEGCSGYDSLEVLQGFRMCYSPCSCCTCLEHGPESSARLWPQAEPSLIHALGRWWPVQPQRRVASQQCVSRHQPSCGLCDPRGCRCGEGPVRHAPVCPGLHGRSSGPQMSSIVAALQLVPASAAALRTLPVNHRAARGNASLGLGQACGDSLIVGVGYCRNACHAHAARAATCSGLS